MCLLYEWEVSENVKTLEELAPVTTSYTSHNLLVCLHNLDLDLLLSHSCEESCSLLVVEVLEDLLSEVCTEDTYELAELLTYDRLNEVSDVVLILREVSWVDRSCEYSLLLNDTWYATEELDCSCKVT